jgi:hypothetical protein
MRSFCSLLSCRKTVPCGRMKKLHAPVGVPPSGLLASLRLLVRGLLSATRPSRLPSGRWRHYWLFAICDLEGHSVSSHSLPPPEPPSQAGRPGRVLYRRVEISVRAHRERLVISSSWQYSKGQAESRSLALMVPLIGDKRTLEVFYKPSRNCVFGYINSYHPDLNIMYHLPSSHSGGLGILPGVPGSNTSISNFPPAVPVHRSLGSPSFVEFC